MGVTYFVPGKRWSTGCLANRLFCPHLQLLLDLASESVFLDMQISGHGYVDQVSSVKAEDDVIGNQVQSRGSCPVSKQDYSGLKTQVPLLPTNAMMATVMWARGKLSINNPTDTPVQRKITPPTDKKTSVASFCPKVFVQSDDLKKHLLIHTDKKKI